MILFKATKYLLIDYALNKFINSIEMNFLSFLDGISLTFAEALNIGKFRFVKLEIGSDRYILLKNVKVIKITPQELIMSEILDGNDDIELPSNVTDIFLIDYETMDSPGNHPFYSTIYQHIVNGNFNAKIDWLTFYQ